MGKLIAEAVAKVGRDGVVNIEDGKGTNTFIETSDGMVINGGWANSNFCLNQEQQETVFENPLIFVLETPLTACRPIVDLLDSVIKTQRPLVIIAPDFGGETLPLFAQNQKVLPAVLVKAPGFGTQQELLLQDIAVLTGAKLVTPKTGIALGEITLEMFGSAGHVKVTAKETVIVDGAGSQEDIDLRIKMIQAEIKQSGSEFDRDKMRERMGKLLGGVCVIKVGAHSELAVKELKGRLEDALYATQSSIAEGVVTGGGLSLLRAAINVKQDYEDFLEEPDQSKYDVSRMPSGDAEVAGFLLVLGSCGEPLKQILTNAGANGEYWKALLELTETEQHVGVDATDLVVKNMLQAGILDPAKVVRSTIQNAVSIVSTFLLMEAAIAKKTAEKY